MKNKFYYPRQLGPENIKNHLQDGIAEIKEAFLDYRFYRTNVLMVIGCFMMAYAVNTFLIPLNLISPGFTGLSMGIFYLTNIGSISLIYTVLNIPLFFLGWKMVSARYLLINVIGTIYFTIALAYTKGFAMPVDDYFLAIFLGALLSGAGGGMYLRYGGAIGGLDIVAFLFKKKLSLPMGTTFFLVNCFNLLLNYFAWDLKATLYSAIYIFIQTYLIHKAQTGFSQTSLVLIVSANYKAIAERLSAKLDRTFTYIKSVGGYSKTESHMIYIVVNQFELSRIKEIVHRLDPKAFISIIPTAEVIGQRFLSWEEEGFVEKKRRQRPRVESTRAEGKADGLPDYFGTVAKAPAEGARRERPRTYHRPRPVADPNAPVVAGAEDKGERKVYRRRRHFRRRPTGSQTPNSQASKPEGETGS